MFKEFGIIFIGFIVAVILLHVMVKKNKSQCYKLVALFCILLILVNTIYNLKFVFPTFVYEGVPIGDSEENLFAYKNDGHFQWQILNTVSNNRKVFLDSEGEFYQEYFNIFSAEVELIEFPKEHKRLLEEQKEKSSHVTILTMVQQLSYAFPPWNGDEFPLLYLNEEDLQGCDTLVVTVEERDGVWDMIVVSEKYYHNLLVEEGLK